MPIFNNETVMLAVLKHLADGKKLTTDETVAFVEKHFGLTEEERNQTVTDLSGREVRIVEDDTESALFLLLNAKTIRIQNKAYAITQRGLDLLATNPEKISVHTLWALSEKDVDFSETIILAVLKHIAAGKELTTSEIVAFVEQHFELTEEERNQTVTCVTGREVRIVEDDTESALFQMRDAKLIEKNRADSSYTITQLGFGLLSTNPEKITPKFLRALSSSMRQNEDSGDGEASSLRERIRVAIHNARL